MSIEWSPFIEHSCFLANAFSSVKIETISDQNFKDPLGSPEFWSEKLMALELDGLSMYAHWPPMCNFWSNLFKVLASVFSLKQKPCFSRKLISIHIFAVLPVSNVHQNFVKGLSMYEHWPPICQMRQEAHVELVDRKTTRILAKYQLKISSMNLQLADQPESRILTKVLWLVGLRFFTLPISKILSVKNARAWLSMVSYLKK